MFNLLAYGSLLHPAELSKHRFDKRNIALVVVHGFRRSFNQEPSWRVRAVRERAVLSVEEHSGASFNAILITRIDHDLLDSLDQRERGYNRICVERSRVHPFLHGDFQPPVCDTYMYCGKSEKRNESLLPNASYFELCIRGAMHWGREFQDAFLSSTFIAGQSAREFSQAIRGDHD